MTYWINIWQNSQPSRIGAEPAVQYWATEQQAIEEIVDGPPGYYYDETIRVEGQRAKVIDLEIPARNYAREARAEQQAEMAMVPSWEPL